MSVQQETDISYGPFKSIVRTNLKNIALTCFRKRINVPLKASTFGLICYGGVCPDLGVVLENALQAAFNTASNLHSWREVNAIPYTKKCLSNPKVRHDGTDANDPQFDVNQDVRSQNHNSTMQLLVMGYSGNGLCAKFIPEKIRERQAASAPVTVENTREQQEALARTSMAGGVFFLTGGQHLTADDGWIASSEMKERKTRAAEMEREKKRRLGNHAMHEEVLPILNRLENELDGNVDRLKDRELKGLLKWKGVPASKMGNVVAKKVLYKKIVEEGGGGEEDEVSIADRWTDANEVALDTLKNAPIEMGDTAYGRYEAEKKKDIERAYKKMTAKGKSDLMRELEELDVEDANDNECTPPSPTPM
jgi:hypothetical protein